MYFHTLLSYFSTRKRFRVESRNQPQFNVLEPRRLLIASPISITGYEGDTAYVDVEVDRWNFPTEAAVSASSGEATHEIDYYVNTDESLQLHQGKIRIPIYLKPDSNDESVENFELTIQLGHRGRPIFETQVKGTIADPIISISAIDNIASEVPLHNLDHDPATVRLSRSEGPATRSTTVYFRVSDQNGNPSFENLAEEADWYVDEKMTLAGYKTIEDPETEGSTSKVSVFSAVIEKGQPHLDLIVSAANDHDFENNELLTFTLVDEFDFDDLGRPVVTKALYELGQEEATITIVDTTADIDVGGLDELAEDDRGILLRLNDDDDNGDGIPDYLNIELPDDQKFLDDDLVMVSIRSLVDDALGFASDFFTLDFNPGNLRLWFNRDKSAGPEGVAEITMETRFPEADADQSIWMEGIGWGHGDVGLVWHDGNNLRDRAFTYDSFGYYLLGADLDIDSDNDGTIQHSNWEDELENHRYGIGKLLEENDRTQIDLRIPEIAFTQGSNVKFVFDYQHKATAGTIWLYKSYPRDVITEEDRISPGVEYSLQDLINHPLEEVKNGFLPLLVVPREEANVDGEDIDQLTELQKVDPEDTIKVTVTIDGESASDEVKYVVANKDSVFWEIQSKPQIRASLASTAVYELKDLPYAGLEILDRTKEDRLRELGVPEVIIKKLNRLSSDNDQLPKGFTAAVYRNYTAGPSSYLIAFAGTNGGELTDWINNASQAVASGSPQYTTAMDVGLGLRLAEGVDELHATGHSLGGGLASAAVVWAGGIQGYTFNAAGLDRDTIENHQDSFNFLRDEATYRNALDRFDAIAAGSREVMAYYNHLDILSVIQDSSEHIPSAVGHRIEIKGKYGNDEWKYFDAHNARRILRRLIPRSLSTKNDVVFLDPSKFVQELADYFDLEIVFPGTIGILIDTYDQLQMFESGIDQLIETHSLFDETLLGEFYGESDE